MDRVGREEERGREAEKLGVRSQDARQDREQPCGDHVEEDVGHVVNERVKPGDGVVKSDERRGYEGLETWLRES